MKRTLSLILAALLLAFTACSESPDNADETQPVSTPAAENTTPGAEDAVPAPPGATGRNPASGPRA